MWTESGDITTRLDQCVTLSCTGVDLCGDKSSSLLSLRVSINHIQQANLTHRVWVQLTLHFRPMDPCDWLTIVQSVKGFVLKYDGSVWFPVQNKSFR